MFLSVRLCVCPSVCLCLTFSFYISFTIFYQTTRYSAASLHSKQPYLSNADKSNPERYLQACRLQSVKTPILFFRFGPHSIEYGHELVKFTDVLTSDLADRKTSHVEHKLSECRTLLKEASDIFELHYGKWNPIYKEIVLKLNSAPFCQI